MERMREVGLGEREPKTAVAEVPEHLVREVARKMVSVQGVEVVFSLLEAVVLSSKLTTLVLARHCWLSSLGWLLMGGKTVLQELVGPPGLGLQALQQRVVSGLPWMAALVLMGLLMMILDLKDMTRFGSPLYPRLHLVFLTWACHRQIVLPVGVLRPWLHPDSLDHCCSLPCYSALAARVQVLELGELLLWVVRHLHRQMSSLLAVPIGRLSRFSLMPCLWRYLQVIRLVQLP